MIKETVITLAFGATLVEKHPQPDIPHKQYWPITEIQNVVRVYGNILASQMIGNVTRCNFAAVLVTE